MADENDTGVTNAVLAPTPAEAPVVKKQRAPRRSKTEIEAAQSASTTTVKSPKVGKQRAAPVAAAPAVVATPVAKIAKKTGAKSTGKTKAASPAKAPAKAPVKAPVKAPTKSKVTASDGIADLIQLEEENKQLRKALAEKLRSENADLRKRLGA